MFKDILEQTFFNNRIIDYITFLGIFVIGIIVVRVLDKIVVNRLKAWAEKTEVTVDDLLVDLIERKVLPILYLGVCYLGIQYLTVKPIVERVINILVLVILSLFAARFLLALINFAFKNFWLKKEDDVSKQNVIKVILTFVKVVLWGIVVVIFLDNIGVKISALVAGLGIGGIAIALAAQAVLGDLFSYFIIFFDRPFEIGDFIIVGDYLGTVEQIGLKTTRLKSLSGEQLVFSNTDLTNSRIKNYKRMDKRRVIFKLGVTYQTGFQKLKEIPQIITDTIKNLEDTVFDRAHFSSYGDFSLDFEVVYYVIGNDYNKYMDIQQEINYKIHEEFETRGIEFAYPTQTLFISKT